MKPRNLKVKLHELIDDSRNESLLENIYELLSRNTTKEYQFDLSQNQVNEVNESIAQYNRGETKPHEEILELLRKWRAA